MARAKSEPPPLPPSGPQAETKSPRWELVVCLAVAALLTFSTWLVPRPIGDLYVAYAGARDVLEGKLGHEDDWSFVNVGTGRVWINQNWGTHMLYYGAYYFFDETGILVLKALLMVSMVAFISLAIRQHGVGWPVALLVGGCAVIGGHAYIDLRPNLILLTLAPMMYWLLVRSRHHPHRIWIPLALLVIWGNMHGSFIFGLGMMGLWSICAGLQAMAREGFKRALRRWWPLLAAPLAGIVLTGTVTPFGFENLTHPLIMGRSEAWRQVAEWRPVLPTAEIAYGTTKEFFIGLGLLAALMSARPLTRLLMGGGQRRSGIADVVMVLFSLCICVAVVWSAFNVMGEVSRGIDRADAMYYDLQAKHQLEANRGPQARRQVLAQLEAHMAMVKGQTAMLRRVYSRTPIPLAAFGALGAGAVYSLFRLLGGLSVKRGRGGTAPQRDYGMLAFDVMLTALVLYMGFTSRRFVTLSFGLFAPLLAVHLNWLFRLALRARFFRTIRPALIAAVAVLVPAAVLFAKNIKHYHPDNPIFVPYIDSVYDRMIDNHLYTHGGAEWFNKNKVSGRAMEEWRWEGFLHWRCPQVKIFVGGRAQQAYDEPIYKLRMNMWNGANLDNLARLRVQFIVVPMDGSASGILNPLLSPRPRRQGEQAPRPRWVPLYFDRDNIIIGDIGYPEVRKLADRLIAGDLWYPKGGGFGEGIGEATRALCMASNAFDFSPDQKRQAIEQANLKMPSMLLYKVLFDMFRSRQLTGEYIRSYFQREYSRLENAHHSPYERMKLIFVRANLAGMLAGTYPTTSSEANQWGDRSASLAEQLKGLRDRWY
ncbi:MAG TPA: hypothetical protein VNA25_29260 [Phycisphaerae bacterium]|nr:hypothetical protein [Phycisphaerae bacterium]